MKTAPSERALHDAPAAVPLVADAPAAVPLVADAPALLLDAVADVDRCVASLLAMRARMIDQSREWMEAAEAARPASRGPIADRERARQTLVSELAPLLRIPAGTAAHL